MYSIERKMYLNFIEMIIFIEIKYSVAILAQVILAQGNLATSKCMLVK